MSGRHVSHLTSGRCAFSYVLTSYISLVPLQVRGAEKDETEKNRRSMLTKGANPIVLYNQQNIRFVIKHFELQIYLIAQIKLWSTRSKLLVTKMSWRSSASCVYACIYVCVLCKYRTNVLSVLLGHCDSQCKSQNIFVYLQNQLVYLIFAKVLASFFFFVKVLAS